MGFINSLLHRVFAVCGGFLATAITSHQVVDVTMNGEDDVSH
jgi:hypothetical protein